MEKGSKKCHENGERNVLFFNVASWRPWKRDARTLVLLLLLLLLPQLASAADHHHHQRWASFPCLCPSLSPCDSSMSFPFHHCHNFVSQSLLPPHFSCAHDAREKALLLCNFCAKNGANFPGPALQSSYFPLSSVRQIAFIAFDKFSIIDRFDGPGSNRSSLKR